MLFTDGLSDHKCSGTCSRRESKSVVYRVVSCGVVSVSGDRGICMADRDQKIFQREQLKWASETIDKKDICSTFALQKGGIYLWEYGYICKHWLLQWILENKLL